MGIMPRVAVPWAGVPDVLVDHKCLDGQDGKQHDKREEKESKEPGFAQIAVC